MRSPVKGVLVENLILVNSNVEVFGLQIKWLVDIFRARIVDISEDLVTVEVSVLFLFLFSCMASCVTFVSWLISAALYY